MKKVFRRAKIRMEFTVVFPRDITGTADVLHCPYGIPITSMAIAALQSAGLKAQVGVGAMPWIEPGARLSITVSK